MGYLHITEHAMNLDIGTSMKIRTFFIMGHNDLKCKFEMQYMIVQLKYKYIHCSY